MVTVKAGLSWTNYVFDAAAALSASSEVTGLGAANLANPIVQVVHRAAATSFYGRCDFGSVRPVGVLALLFPRTLPMLAATDTIRHLLSAVAPGGSELLDTGAVASGVVDGYGYHLYVPAAPISARYWQWTVSAPSLAARAAVDTGVAWAGALWQPARNFGYGWSRGWGDGSRIDETPKAGAEYVDAGPRRRAVDLNFGALSDDESDTLEDMLRLAGLASPVLFLPDPTAAKLPRRALYGRLAALDGLSQPHFNLFAAPLRLRETL